MIGAHYAGFKAGIYAGATLAYGWRSRLALTLAYSRYNDQGGAI